MLDAQQVQELIEGLQTRRLELCDVEAKTAASELPRLHESLSALSNQRGGGVILLGVDENKGFAVTGVQDVAKMQADIVSLAADSMEPPIRVEPSVTRFGGQIVLAAEVPECDPARKPCYVKTAGLYKGSYVRVGASNRRMSDYEIYLCISARKQPRNDVEPVREASLDDLEHTLVDEYVALRHKAMPRLHLQEMPRGRQLTTLRIAVEQDGLVYPTLAGVLMFGKYPQQFFPSLVVTFLRFAGTDETTPGPHGERFLDNRKFEGRIPELLNDTLNRIEAQMQTRALITGLLRQDIPEYPVVAIREALVNAVAHRDYSDYVKGSYIQVRMFADRLEIQSPGGLYGAVTEDNIDHERSTRNSILMRMLEDFRLVENRGSGIMTIVQAMRQASLEPPQFADRKASFCVTFQNHTMMDARAVQWLGQFSGMKLNDHQRLALVYMRRHGHIANRDHQRLSFVDGRSATKDLRNLVDQGLIYQHSTRGGAHYTLANHLGQHDISLPSLSESEAKVVEYLASHEYVTNPAVRGLLNVDYSRASYVLKRMVSLGILRSEGRTRGMTISPARFISARRRATKVLKSSEKF